MTFWWRELGGWLLIGLGLVFFASAYRFCETTHIVEAWPMALIGVVIFWGGIHLLKVAIAARICQQAQMNEAAQKRR